MKWFILFLLIFSDLVTVMGQDSLNHNTLKDSPISSNLSFEDQYRQEYEKRIRKSHINGFYIPADLLGALRILDEIVDKNGQHKFASQDEDFAVKNVYFSFGRWINVNWGMEQGSRLTVALNKLGVSYPDDMTKLIMYAWHRHLRKRPLDLDQLVEKVILERQDLEEKARIEAQQEP